MKKVDKVAIGAGVTGGVGTGSAIAITTAGLSGPAANLGVYAAAQTLLAGTGLGGAALATGIAAVGGPIVAVPLAILGVGGVCWGGVKLVGKLFGKKRW